MPHGSGGGSHSSGSHHSSHSSRSGSHSGGTTQRYSNRYFRGARRFRYYHNGQPHYLYSNRAPQKTSTVALIIQFIFLLPFFATGIGLLIGGILSFKPLKPLDANYVSPQSRVGDYIDIIADDEEAELEATLKDFEELTGISPYVVTVSDSLWTINYSNLEAFAYDLYVNDFSDEQHFLVVYSEPDNASELDFVDWSWEGMQGNETDPILTEDNFSTFQADLQKELTRNSVSVGEAFNIAFGNSLDYIMEGHSNSEAGTSLLLIGAFWSLMISGVFISTIKSFIHSKRNYEEIPLNDTAVNSTSNFNSNVSANNTYTQNSYMNNYGSVNCNLSGSSNTSTGYMDNDGSVNSNLNSNSKSYPSSSYSNDYSYSNDDFFKNNRYDSAENFDVSGGKDKRFKFKRK